MHDISVKGYSFCLEMFLIQKNDNTRFNMTKKRIDPFSHKTKLHIINKI